MMSKKRPQLRFEGFTDDWEERKLGDFLKTPEKVKAHIQSKDDLMTLKLNLGGLESGSKRETLELGSTIYYKRKSGQFIYGKQNFFNGSMAIIPIDLDGKATSGDVPSLDVIGILSEYLYVYVSRGDYWKSKESEASGTGSKRIHEKTLQGFDIKVPSTQNEQRKIGSFFKQLDDTIALHQRKLDLLKEQKKGYLQKMFPKNGAKVPELRFAGFADDWEDRKLSELATMNARIGWQNLRTSEFLDNGDYMLITGTDFKAGAIDYSNIHYVEKERFEQDKKIQISNKSILITKDGTLGKVAYVEDLTMPATLNAGVFNVKVKEDLAIDSKYLFHYLKAPFLLKFADQRSTGGTIKHLNQNVLVEFPIPLPSLGEQHKIAGLLSNFDNTIALHQRKLDLLKEQKKGFLQKMFI